MPTLAAVLLALVLAPTPTPTADAPRTITVDGIARQYLLHVPPGHDPAKPAPLVMVLHGHGQQAKAMVKSTGFDAIADREGFVVVYLQGTLGTDGKPAWNTGITPQTGVTANDVKFVRMLAAELKTTLGVDPQRIYAAGFSNGGFMTHRLAAQASDLFAAVGVVEGTIGTQQDGAWEDIVVPTGPLPIAIMHGTKDTAVAYDGGTVANGHTTRSVADAVARWTKANGCTGKPVKTTLVANEVITTDYTLCKQTNEVLLYTFVHGKHEWPTLTNAAKIAGSEELWKFFARHARSKKVTQRDR